MLADSLKLIALGKIMEDEKTMSDYNITDGKFLVAMVQKAKKKPAEPKPEEVKEEEVAPAEPLVEQPAAADAAAEAAPADAAVAASANIPAQPAQPADEFNPEQQAALTEMENMGFPRDQCEAAYRAAFFNSERAIEYLLNGIPEGALQQPSPVAPPQPAPGTNTGAGAATAGAPAAAGGQPDFSALTSNPMFAQLRERMLSDPNFLQQFMTQLQTTQPQLFAQIQSNPQAFLAALVGNEGGIPGMEGGEGGDGADPPNVIRVTQDEKEAIERLQSLGFPRHRAIEAYMSCDKNEEWAANYLFENSGADDQWEQEVVQEESLAGQDPAAAQDPAA